MTKQKNDCPAQVHRESPFLHLSKPAICTAAPVSGPLENHRWSNCHPKAQALPTHHTCDLLGTVDLANSYAAVCTQGTRPRQRLACSWSSLHGKLGELTRSYWDHHCPDCGNKPALSYSRPLARGPERAWEDACIADITQCHTPAACGEASMSASCAGAIAFYCPYAPGSAKVFLQSRVS